jgi:hypothetical protein
MADEAESGLKQVCIPIMLQTPVLTMSTSGPVPQAMHTIFVGIVDNTYTHEHWNHDMEQVERIFPRIDTRMEAKMTLVGQFHDIPEFGKQLDVAEGQLNQFNIQAIRIVALGFYTRSYVTEALAHIVRSWAVPAANKQVEFITMGDSEDSHCLNFCKDLCLERRCQTLRYMNLDDCDIFGSLKSKRD